jgi:hypothetical protein
MKHIEASEETLTSRELFKHFCWHLSEGNLFLQEEILEEV